MTEIMKELRERFSPRAFSDEPVEAEKITRLFEAARWAASCFNEQPWRFVFAQKGDSSYENLKSCMVEFNQKWAGLAPLLILTIAKTNFTQNGKPNRHAWHDVGLAVGNLSAEAMHLGLFVHQMAGILPDRARNELKIPDGFEPVTMIAVGYLGDPDLLPDDLAEQERAARESRSRKPIQEVAFRGTWGEP